MPSEIPFAARRRRRRHRAEPARGPKPYLVVWPTGVLPVRRKRVRVACTASGRREPTDGSGNPSDCAGCQLPGAGMAPSWVRSPRRSAVVQRSTTRPSRNRMMVWPFSTKRRPVAGTPHHHRSSTLRQPWKAHPRGLQTSTVLSSPPRRGDRDLADSTRRRVWSADSSRSGPWIGTCRALYAWTPWSPAAFGQKRVRDASSGERLSRLADDLLPVGSLRSRAVTCKAGSRSAARRATRARPERGTGRRAPPERRGP